MGGRLPGVPLRGDPPARFWHRVAVRERRERLRRARLGRPDCPLDRLSVEQIQRRINRDGVAALHLDGEPSDRVDRHEAGRVHGGAVAPGFAVRATDGSQPLSDDGAFPGGRGTELQPNRGF